MIARRVTLAAFAFSAVLGLGAAPAFAAQTSVAVAANFTEPAKAIAAAFAKATGHTATLSFGASGVFYTQITQGAPFEVLLSADSERPQKAEAEGFGVPGSRFTYAAGRLVLYSKTPGFVTDGPAAVARAAKVSIADPQAAPYGVAAVEVLTRLGLYDRVKPKLVLGSSIAQAYQFVETGAAQVGFVALSQVIKVKGGSRWVVPASDHSPIDQQAILLRAGASSEAAKAFMTFLKSPASTAIIRAYGYEVK